MSKPKVPSIGDKLRGFRVEKGWTLSQAMEKSGIDRSHISKVELDRFGDVRVSTVVKLLKVYGKTWKDLDAQKEESQK